MKQIRKRLTYANVMSSIAVFLVLGGASALAATQLAKNSVGTKQLKNNAVTTSKIKNNAVTTSKIKNGAVTGAKLQLNTIGKVPSASNADHATSADTAASANSANNVNGVFAAKINYLAEDVAGFSTIYSNAGLTLKADCGAADEVHVIATTSTNDASIYTTVVDTDENDNNANEDEESGAFDVGDEFDLLAGEDANPSFVTFEYDTSVGTTVTGIIVTDEDNTPGPECQIHGVVFSA